MTRLFHALLIAALLGGFAGAQAQSWPAGTGVLTVPYATMPLGIQDTLAGRTQLVILAVPAAAPRIRSGELRPLAASFAKRVPGYEDVPAISETFPGFELVGWFLVVAPAGTPKEIVLRMNRELDRILKIGRASCRE